MARKKPRTILNDVVIISAARTPIGKYGGALRNIPATELGGIVIKEVLQRTGLPSIRGRINEVIMGQVLQAGAGQAPARQAMIYARMPKSCGAVTIRKECGSSLAAIVDAYCKILSKEYRAIIAGGMESMSQSPGLVKKVWTEENGKIRHTGWDLEQITDSMLRDGLQDPYQEDHPHMGVFADVIAEQLGISRYDQDKFALQSHERAAEASKGKFLREIVPVPVLQENGEVILFSKDEGIRPTSLEKLSKLPLAFRPNNPNGTITAGNASQISDGAAALLLMSDIRAKGLGLTPMARIVAQATHSISPEYFPVAPKGAIKKVLQKSGLSLADIDLVESNEAFADVPLAAIKEPGIPNEKINVNGGAIALGHPIGESGARIMVTLLYALQERGGRYGIATACIGGGEAIAILVENLIR